MNEAAHDDPVNTTDGIHDPAQSWNALTVGAVTFKGDVDPNEARGANVLALVGGLSPYGCTSGALGDTIVELRVTHHRLR
jgi:hypothetical protein